jgi:hypothetical protein
MHGYIKIREPYLVAMEQKSSLHICRAQQVFTKCQRTLKQMRLSGPRGVISVSLAVLKLAAAFIHKQQRPVIPPITQYPQNTINIARFSDYQNT